MTRTLTTIVLCCRGGCAAPLTQQTVLWLNPSGAETPLDLSPTPQPGHPNQRIRIAAVDDMMLGTDYLENRLPEDDGANFFKKITPILSSADLTLGNLEDVLVDGGKPGKRCGDPKACYLFRSPPIYAEHYKRAGFDVISLPNNHACEFGEEGGLASMHSLANAGNKHSGLKGSFTSLATKGLDIAMLAYASHQAFKHDAWL